MTPPAAYFLSSQILESSTDGTVFHTQNDSSWDLMGRRIGSALIVAGAFGYVYYKCCGPKPNFVSNVKFSVINLQGNELGELGIREQPASTDEMSDQTLRSVDSLASVSSKDSSISAASPSAATADAATQKSEETQASPPTSEFRNGPVGAVEEEPPKDGKVTKSIQCGGNLIV